MSSSIPVEIPQKTVVGQQRQQISELQLDKFLLHILLRWKIRFRNQVTTCSDFPSEAMLWINEVEMVDSLEDLKSSRSIARKNFPNFEMLDAKIASALNKIIQNFFIQYLMVAVEWTLVELKNQRMSMTSELMKWAASSKEQGDLFCTLTHQDTQSGILTIFKFVVVRSFTVDGNLPQPTGGCEQNTLTRHIFSCLRARLMMSHTALAQGAVRVIPSICHAPVCLFVPSSTLALHSSFCLSHLPLHLPELWLLPFLLPCGCRRIKIPCALRRGSVRSKTPCALPRMRSLALWLMSPTSLTTTTSQTTEIFIQESSSDSRPSNLHDWEICDYTIGRALSSPLFTQEREDPASRRQAYHSPEEGLSSSQSSSVGHVRTGRPVSDQFDSLIPNVRENPRRRDSENEQIRILLERQREQILGDCQAEIQKYEFQADYDRRSIQKLNEMVESQRGEIYRAHQGDEQLRRDQQFFHAQLLEQNRDLRDAHEKSLKEVEELKRFQGSTFDTISRRKLVEDRDTILQLTGKIEELQNEINCMNDSRDFQDAESVRRVFFSTSSKSRRNAKPFYGNAEPQQWVAKYWGHTWYIGKRFCKSNGSSSAPYPQESNPWISNVSEHTTPHVTSESQTPVQDQRCQSRPSARNSVVPSEGGFSKSYGADQQRPQISDPHFDKFPTSATLACWKIRFGTEVCVCSQFPTEAIGSKNWRWVDSVDDLKSSCSVGGIRMPNFEVLAMRRLLQHWTESFIIPSSKGESVWRNKKPRKRTVSFVAGRLLTWTTITSGSLEPMILSRIMPTYSHLFYEMTIFRNSIRNGTEFCQWQRFHLMTSWKDCTN